MHFGSFLDLPLENWGSNSHHNVITNLCEHWHRTEIGSEEARVGKSVPSWWPGGVPSLRPGKPSPGRVQSPRQCTRASLGFAFGSFLDFFKITVDFWIDRKCNTKQKNKVFQNPLLCSNILPNGAQSLNFHICS